MYDTIQEAHIDNKVISRKYSYIATWPVARGGVVGVPTPPSEINDIHNTNGWCHLIQERPFDCF